MINKFICCFLLLLSIPAFAEDRFCARGVVGDIIYGDRFGYSDNGHGVWIRFNPAYEVSGEAADGFINGYIRLNFRNNMNDPAGELHEHMLTTSRNHKKEIEIYDKVGKRCDDFQSLILHNTVGRFD